MSTKFVPFERLMDSEEYDELLDAVDASSGDFARFLGSDRTTGYRWRSRNGPPNGAARLLQLMAALNLTLANVKTIIAKGQKRRGRVYEPD